MAAHLGDVLQVVQFALVLGGVEIGDAPATHAGRLVQLAP